MIELIELTKRYGALVAVDRLSLTVERGEVFGFIGPNGAGKTTTIRMMMGLLQPTSGRVVLGGHDLEREPLQAKRLCGFVPDGAHLYSKLTGAEYLDLVAGLYDVPEEEVPDRRVQLLQMFGLTDRADELVETYSHGMKQRVALAAALIHAPQILVLDEPVIGMDPRGARLLKRTLRALARAGVTVFVSTHSLGLAEEICHRIAIVTRGRLAATGTVADLARLAGCPLASSLEDIFLALTRSGGGDSFLCGVESQHDDAHML